MLGMCPECKLAHPIDSDDRMMNHPDSYGTYVCAGSGQDCGVVLKSEPKRKIDRSFDREMGDEDEHSPDSTCGVVGLPAEKESPIKEEKPLLPPKPSIFGSIGDQIELGLRKLSQKERKVRK